MPVTTAAQAKEYRLRTVYKQTPEEHEALRTEQNNACAICTRPFSTYMAFQDHWHACCPRKLKQFCGKCNRGLLCFSCNKYVVGVLERQSIAGTKLNVINLLDSLKAYFEKWKVILEERGACATKTKTKKLRKK